MGVLCILVHKHLLSHQLCPCAAGGDGPKKALLQQMISTEGLEGRVQLTGAIPHERARDFLVRFMCCLKLQLGRCTLASVAAADAPSMTAAAVLSLAVTRQLTTATQTWCTVLRCTYGPLHHVPLLLLLLWCCLCSPRVTFSSMPVSPRLSAWLLWRQPLLGSWWCQPEWEECLRCEHLLTDVQVVILL